MPAGTTFTENWDGVTAPAVATGWAGDTTQGVTNASKGFHTSPNAMYPPGSDSALRWLYYNTVDDKGGDGTIVSYINLDSTPGGSGNSTPALLAYRITATGSASVRTCYEVQLFTATDATNGLYLYRQNAGTGTTLASVLGSALLPLSVSKNYKLTIVALGHLHKVELQRLDNNQYLTSSSTWSATQQYAISFTDSGGSAFTGAGKFGHIWYLGGTDRIAFDTFTFTPTAVSVALDSYSINVSATAQATPTGFTGGTAVTYSSSNAGIASVNSSTGVVTGVSAGTCTITATGIANNTQIAVTSTLTVVALTPAVSPTTATIDQLATTTITASGFTGGTVTWSSSATGTATVNASTGVVTGVAHGQATNQTATITATGVSNPAQTATCVVTVRAVSVSVSPSTATVGINTTQTFTATVTGTTNTAVTWTVSAGTGSINASTGVYTAPSSAGSATVRATSTADSARNGTASVSIIVATTITNTGYFGPGYKNLAGTVGVTIYSLSGATLTSVQSRATSGIVESGTNITGDYLYQFTGAAPGTTYVFVWDTGGSTPVYYTDTMDAFPKVRLGDYATGQDPATLLLLTPANLIASDSSGRVTSNTTQIAGSTPAATALSAQALGSFQGVVSSDTSPTTTSFTANTTGSTGLSTTNGFYSTPNSLIVFYSGTLQGKTSYCTGYTVAGGIGTFTLGSAFPTAPTATDKFFVISTR